MKQPAKKDILYAAAGIVALIVLSGLLNKCEAAELDLRTTSGWYTEMGFGYTKDDNVFCRDDPLRMYGIIHFGYNLDESMRVQYRHNSCVSREHDEGSLDAVEVIFRF